MAKHEITIFENTSCTSENAPYLGRYHTKGTSTIAERYDEMAKLSGLPKIQIQAILEGAFNTLAEWETTELARYYTDVGYLSAKISGTFPSADAAFDPTRNSLDLLLYLTDDIKLNLAAVTPNIVTDETLTRVEISNVMDVAVNRPLNLIHGQHPFRVAGYHLVTTDQGASVSLVDLKTNAVYPCTVDSNPTMQVFTAHTNALLEGGDYKLVVTSRGGDAEGPLQTVTRNVKYLKVKNVISFENLACSLAAEKATGVVLNGEGIEGWDPENQEFVGNVYKDGTLVQEDKVMSWDSTTHTLVTEIGSFGLVVGSLLKIVLKRAAAKAGTYEPAEVWCECIVTA